MTDRDSPQVGGGASRRATPCVGVPPPPPPPPRRGHSGDSARATGDAVAPAKDHPSTWLDVGDAPFEPGMQPAALRHTGTGAQLRPMPGLPIPVPPDAARGAGIRCVVTPVDRDGRLAARSVLTFMGWSVGQAVKLAIEPGPIVVARTGRTVRINPRGHLRLPLAVRRRCRIAAGDRVLVAANQQQGELLVIPMATLDDMVAVYRQADDSGAGQ
jgi:bifunctional DNA-binding transcriptional regulator/antitoxin component of YhaV-PrlF toxin-antitoxin module